MTSSQKFATILLRGWQLNNWSFNHQDFAFKALHAVTQHARGLNGLCVISANLENLVAVPSMLEQPLTMYICNLFFYPGHELSLVACRRSMASSMTHPCAHMPALPYSFAKGSIHSASSAMPAALGCRASGIKSGDSCIALGTY